MTSLILETSGWAVTQDAAGLNRFQSALPDVFVLQSPAGDLCAPYAESLGTSEASKHLFTIIVAGVLSLDSAKGRNGCDAYALSEGVMAENHLLRRRPGL